MAGNICRISSLCICIYIRSDPKREIRHRKIISFAFSSTQFVFTRSLCSMSVTKAHGGGFQEPDRRYPAETMRTAWSRMSTQPSSHRMVGCLTWKYPTIPCKSAQTHKEAHPTPEEELFRTSSYQRRGGRKAQQSQPQSTDDEPWHKQQLSALAHGIRAKNNTAGNSHPLGVARAPCRAEGVACTFTRRGINSRETPRQAVGSGEFPEANTFDSLRLNYSAKEEQERPPTPCRR